VCRPIPRAVGAICEVENPGFAASVIPRAVGAIYEVENPGFAASGIGEVDVASWAVTRLTIPSVVIAAALVLAACGGTGTGATTTTASETSTTLPEVALDVVPRNYAEFRAQATACGAEAPDELTPVQFDAPADVGINPDQPLVVIMSTTCGDIEIELDPSLAPETVNSFMFLAAEGYFDGVAFHRVIPGFVVQGGDQTATGIGGPGYTIPDELPPAEIGYERGTLAMANAGPGTTGSQFFLVLEDVGLPPLYSIFGKVTAGLDVLDLLQGVPLGQAAGSADPTPSTPLESIYINGVKVKP